MNAGSAWRALGVAWLAGLLALLACASVWAADAHHEGGGFIVGDSVVAHVHVHTPDEGASRAPIDLALVSPARWTMLRSDTAYPASGEQPLWLRLDLQVSATREAQALVLSLPQPYIDQVHIWVRRAGEPLPSGYGDAAGEYVPRSLWQRPGAFIQHGLPELAPGQHSVWLRVVQQGAWRPIIRLTDAAEAAAMRESHVVQQTAVFGFLLAVAAISAALAWVHRSGTQAWFAVFAASSALALLIINGLAALWLWPSVGRLSEKVVPSVAMLQMASALMCVRWVLRDRRIAVLPRSALFAAGCVMLAAMVLVYIDASTTLALVAWCGACCLILTLAAWQLVQAREHPRLLASWGVFLLLTLLALVVSVAEMLGLARFSEQPVLSPTLSLSALVVYLMFAIPMHLSRMSERLAHRRLRSEYDPLTGALQPEAARRALHNAWAYARSAEKSKPGCVESDVAVAFVRLRSPHNADRALVGQRGVRMLRTVARGQDAVGWVDNHTLMLLMPGLGDDSVTRGMLARLVALSLMNDATDSRDVYLTVRIAVTTRQNFGESLELLQASLMATLQPQRGGWGDQSIRWLERPAASEELQRTQRPRRWWMSSLSGESAVTTDPPFQRTPRRVRREAPVDEPTPEAGGLTTGRSPS